MSELPRPNELPRSEILGWVLGAVALVALTAGPGAATRALWTDELFSLTTAEENAATILKLLADYQPGYFDHPPLYFLLLRSVLLFGNSPLALRFLSLLFAAGALALWSLEARRGGLSLGAAAALMLLLALHPSLRLHAQEVRMYSLVLFLAAAAWTLTRRLYEARGRRRFDLAAALAFVLAAMLYTSYFSILFLAGLLCLASCWALRPPAADLPRSRASLLILLSCAAALLLFAPWTPVLFKLLTREGDRIISNEGDRLIEVVRLARELAGSKVALAALVGGWCAMAFNPILRATWLPALFALVLLPFSLLAVLAPPSRVVLVRYIEFSIPIALVGSALGWQGLVRKVSRPALAAPFAALLILLPAPFYHALARQSFLQEGPDWWGAAEIIEANALPREFILTGGYLSGEAMLYHLDRPERFSFIHYVTELDRFRSNCRDPGVVWFVNAAPLPPAHEQILHRYFPYRAQFRGNMTFRVIQVYSKKSFLIPWGGDAIYHEPRNEG